MNVVKQTINTGLFISFEGGEGSGKTTQSKLLNSYLSNLQYATEWTREIGGHHTAEAIRELIINNDLTTQTELLLVMAARTEHVTKLIKPALSKNKIVICDRFVDSTAVYQGSELGFELIYNMHKQLFDNLLPDITFLMSIRPEIALQRAFDRGSINKFELKPLSYHQKLYDNYHKLAEIFPGRIKLITADASQTVIHAQIIDILAKQLNLS